MLDAIPADVPHGGAPMTRQGSAGFPLLPNSGEQFSLDAAQAVHVAHVPFHRSPTMGSRYPQRYPDPLNDESPAEAELAKSLRSLGNDGGRCRSRTYDPLIKRDGFRVSINACWTT